MGRHKKTIEEHKANGTYRPDRHEPIRHEPAYKLEPSFELDENGMAEWKRVVTCVGTVGVSAADAAGLTALAHSWQMYCMLKDKAEQLIRAEEYSTEFSRVMSGLTKAFSNYKTQASSFALSPKSRASLGIVGMKAETADDAVDNEFKEMGGF